MVTLTVEVGGFEAFATGEMEGCENVVDDGAGVEGFCVPSVFLILGDGIIVVLRSFWASDKFED